MITTWGDEVDSLDKLVEECAELIHICQKIKRFGILNYNPVTNVDNSYSLIKEITDVQDAIMYVKKEYGL